MNLLRLSFVIFTIAVFTVGCSRTEPVATITPKASPAVTPVVNATPDELGTARLTYAKHCATCHGVNGEGGTGEVDGKKIKAPPLASGHALKHSDDDFVKQISKGGDGMPAFGDKLSANDIGALVRFMRHDFQRAAVSSDPRSDVKSDVAPELKTGVKKIAPVVK